MLALIPDLMWLLGPTLLLFGPFAFATGQNVARNWQAWPISLAYCSLLAIAEALAAYGLSDGSAFALLGATSFDNLVMIAIVFLMSALVLSTIGLFAWRFTLAGMMVRQYPWLYERTGPLSWRSKGSG